MEERKISATEEQKVQLECLYEYKDAGLIQIIRKYGELQEEE